ncbi:MAG: STAS domain-containing protein [Mycobacteriaceae bacterium]|nr:STAS domain-containing protein [Mycobacteriaceae bacterium]
MTGTEPITTSVQHREGVAVLSVGGEIDLATAPSFEEAIDGALAEDPLALIIDLSEVTFLASAGLQLLVATHQRIGESAAFAVVAEGPATSRPMQLTKLDNVIALYPELDEALIAVRPRPRLV